MDLSAIIQEVPCVPTGMKISALLRQLQRDKAHLAAALGLDTGRPVLVLTDDDNAANRFAADLRGFSERDIVQLPSRELVMADVVGVSRGYEQRRLAALDELTEAHFAVASVQAAAQRTMPPEALKAAIVSLATGETAPLDELAQSLTRAGYERCVQVEGTGQFSIRGGILDVFPPQAEHPEQAPPQLPPQVCFPCFF